jgi:phosphoserine aminotransferase
MLPCEVLEAASEALVNYKDSGISVMELGVGNPEYTAIFSEAESHLRELLKVPQGYKIFFMNGGSDVQYSAIPLNLLSDHKCADYVLTGRLSKQASIEAKKYGDIAIAANSAGATPAFSTVPYLEQKHFRPDADYVHICFNNTYYGTKFNYVPKTGNIPLVADMSSFLLSEPIEVNEFALIYASTASCLGISGMTIVIVRDDLLGKAGANVPAMLDYKLMADNDSMYNTPPCWCIYMAKLVF